LALSESSLDLRVHEHSLNSWPPYLLSNANTSWAPGLLISCRTRIPTELLVSLPPVQRAHQL